MSQVILSGENFGGDVGGGEFSLGDKISRTDENGTWVYRVVSNTQAVFEGME